MPVVESISKVFPDMLDEQHHYPLVLRIHLVLAARQGHPGQALVILAMPLEGHPIQGLHKGPLLVEGHFQGLPHMGSPPPTFMACIRVLQWDRLLGVTWGQALLSGPLQVTWALLGHLQWGTCPALPHRAAPLSVAT